MQLRRTVGLRFLVGVGLLGLAVQASVMAQPLTNVSVKLGSVSESRHSSWKSTCTLGLQFEAPAAALLKCTVTRAVDNLDHDLTPPAASLTGRQRAAEIKIWRERQTRSFMQTASLSSPARRAESIRLLEGEVELADPTLANGGIVVISNILETSGIVMSNSDLQVAQVRLVRLKRSEYEERKATMVRTNQSLFIHGGRDSLPPVTVDAERDPKMYVILDAEDPEGNLLGVLFEDAQGRALPVGGTRSTAGLTVFHFQQPLPAELNLRVFLASPGSRSKAKFKLENIPLP